jgi:hypothetical protein
VAGEGSRVRLDLNSPAFQEVFFRLEASESRQVVAALGRLLGMAMERGSTPSASASGFEPWDSERATSCDWYRFIRTTILPMRGKARPSFVAELHDPESGRIDARQLASYLDVPLSALSRVQQSLLAGEGCLVMSPPSIPSTGRSVRWPNTSTVSSSPYRSGR